MSEAKKGAGFDLAQVKQELLARKLELESEMSSLHQEKFADDEVQDPGDQALTSTMESLRSSLQDSKISELHRIVKALEMIENGTYGVCVDCGQPISAKRLKSFPNATRCISCQEAYEESGGGGL